MRPRNHAQAHAQALVHTATAPGHVSGRMPQRVHNSLQRWHRLSIYLTTAVLLLSGVGWLVAVYLLAPPGEPTPAPHVLAGPLLAVHGVAAYVALVVCALVGQSHLRAGWRLPLQRTAGIMLCVALLGLALTGLGFYYVANEAAVPWLRWSHVALGGLLPAALAWHIVRGRRLARRR